MDASQSSSSVTLLKGREIRSTCLRPPPRVFDHLAGWIRFGVAVSYFDCAVATLTRYLTRRNKEEQNNPTKQALTACVLDVKGRK